ncbi:MAG: hypothetical protein ACFCU1_06255 [Sumerlaeia bacterium]
MNNKKIVLGIILATLAVIIAVVVIQQRRTPAPLETDTFSDVAIRQTPQNKTMQKRTNTGDSDFNITGLTEEGEQVRQDNIEQMTKLDVDFDLNDADLMNPDMVSQLVDKYGSYAELYRLLNEEQRTILIDFLQFKNELRDHLGPILGMEESSDVRAFMLLRVQPNSIGISSRDDLLDTVDRDLIAIMDQPTLSAINELEWVSRMQLANQIDGEYALNWTRDAANAFPEDLETNFVANSLTLKIGASVDSVSINEREKAENYLKKSLLSEQAQEINPDDRIAAYYSLSWVDDKNKSLEFYRERVELESDPKAKGILEGLISFIEEQTK